MVVPGLHEGDGKGDRATSKRITNPKTCRHRHVTRPIAQNTYTMRSCKSEGSDIRYRLVLGIPLRVLAVAHRVQSLLERARDVRLPFLERGRPRGPRSARRGTPCPSCCALLRDLAPSFRLNGSGASPLAFPCPRRDAIDIDWHGVVHTCQMLMGLL